jgi:hypothetical protein
MAYFPYFEKVIGGLWGARGSIVGWGTMQQAWKLRDPFPMRSLDFFNWPNPSSRTMALGSTQPPTWMNTRNLPGGKGRPERKVDNLTAMCEPIVQKMWEPRRLTTIWDSTACYRDSLHYIFFNRMLMRSLGCSVCVLRLLFNDAVSSEITWLRW